MNHWVAMGVVLALGLAIIFAGPLVGLCVDQVQGVMLLLAATVAAGYAALTWGMLKASRDSADASEAMANATQNSVAKIERLAQETKGVAVETRGIAEQTNRSVRVMMTGLDLAHGTDLFAWLVNGWSGRHGPVSVYRVHNTGQGAALNVVVHPMWGEWDADGREEAGPILPSINPNPPQQENLHYDPEPPNRQCRLPVLAPRSWGHVAASGHAQDGDVLGIRWDDPVREMRRWRCWKILVEDREGRSFTERWRLEAPVSNCDKCPERKYLGRCPREWFNKNREEFECKAARKYYGREDPLQSDRE